MLSAGNKAKLREFRHKQMEYFLENMTEPVFAPDDAQSNTPFNKAAITLRLLNYQGWGRGKHDEDEPSYMSVAVFMSSIQDYLPPELKFKKSGMTIWTRRSFGADRELADRTIELLEQMQDRLSVLKEKIEDRITGKYYWSNKPQFLEILKRRFKNNWSERTEQAVDATVGPKKIEVHFDDDEDKDNDNQ